MGDFFDKPEVPEPEPPPKPSPVVTGTKQRDQKKNRKKAGIDALTVDLEVPDDDTGLAI